MMNDSTIENHFFVRNIIEINHWNLHCLTPVYYGTAGYRMDVFEICS